MVAVLGLIASIALYIVTDIECNKDKLERARLRAEAERAYYGE